MSTAFLFTLIVKATIAMVAAWTCVRLLSRASAAVRSGVWAASLVVSLALPFAMILAPAWSVGAVPFSSVTRTVGAVVSDTRRPNGSTA